MGYTSKDFTDKKGEAINTLFALYHYGEKIADFRLGAEPEWFPTNEKYANIIPIAEGENIPTFLRNLKPEGWLKQNLKWKSDAENGALQVDYISQGVRYLSNFIIKQSDKPAPKAHNDVLLDHLDNYVDDRGKFRGHYEGPNGRAGNPEFEKRLSEFWRNRNTARYSGAEIKTPHCLNPDGRLEIAYDRPFNVLLKHAGQDCNDALGMSEFMGMSMAKAAGIETPRFCVIEQADGYPPIFAVERYDIPEYGDNSNTRVFTQDFSTLLGKASDQKGVGTILEVAKKLRAMNENAENGKLERNMEMLFKRTVLSWVANDADMHLKNLSVLMKYDSETKKLISADFSPSYDITINTQDTREGSSQTLGVEGKTKGFKLKTFLQLAKRLDIYTDENGNFSPEIATKAIHDVATKAAHKAVNIHREPPIENLSEHIRYDMSVMVSHVVDRARGLGADTPEWDSEPVWKEIKKKGLKARQQATTGLKATELSTGKRSPGIM